MRSGAAARGAEAHHARAIERRGVGGREVFGDEDAVRRILGLLERGAGENREHAQADIAQVVRALREQLIAQPASRSAWVVTAFFQAKAALLPLAIADSAISSRSGSVSSSSCAAKIAALAGSRLA